MDAIDYFDQMWQLAVNGELKGIWFYAACYAFVTCLYSLFFQLRTRQWPFVKGELANLNVGKFGAPEMHTANQNYHADALYRYRVAGREYGGSRVSPWIFITSHNARIIIEQQLKGITRFNDGTVKVFYNPSKPRKSFLILPGRLGMGVTIALATLPFIGFYSRFYL